MALLLAPHASISDTGVRKDDIEPRLAQQLAATVRGSGVSWQIAKQRYP